MTTKSTWLSTTLGEMAGDKSDAAMAMDAFMSHVESSPTTLSNGTLEKMCLRLGWVESRLFAGFKAAKERGWIDAVERTSAGWVVHLFPH